MIQKQFYNNLTTLFQLSKNQYKMVTMLKKNGKSKITIWIIVFRDPNFNLEAQIHTIHFGCFNKLSQLYLNFFYVLKLKGIVIIFIFLRKNDFLSWKIQKYQ